ncbi:F-box/LRR-repeat protein 14 [Sergentomyia squamirostris]
MEDSYLMLTEIPGGLISHRPHHQSRYAPYPLHQPHLQQPSPAPQLYFQQQQARTVQRPKSPLAPSPPPEGTHISHLYPEILTIIFAKLNVRDRGQAAQVCTAWRDAAYSKSVWKGVEACLHLRRKVSNSGVGREINIFPSLVRRGVRKVQVLSLKKGTLKDVVVGVPNLESLNLSGCYNINDANLEHAFSHELTHLKVLDLSLCKQITDMSLRRIGMFIKNLEVLELGGCSNVTNLGLLWIAFSLRKLKRLNLRSCWHISDQGIGHLAGLSQETESWAGLGKLELEYLGLQDCQRLSDESLKYISQGLTSLKSINLSFCVSVTDSGLKYLAKMPKLEELNLRACDNISDIGMAYLTDGGSTIFSLDVSFCDKIGDQALIHISQGLFHLRSLSLNASGITDDGLDRIAKSLHDLETLNIGQCNRISDKGLKTLADNLQNLKAIDLYGCTRLSAQGLELIMKLPKLETLNLGLWHVR